MMDYASDDRIIVLVDMDCFYVQVEQKLCPEFDNKPCAVAQYNNWKGGGIIAVNYEARAFGIKRGMKGDLAKKLCPELHNFRVPEVRGKADLTRYREAGASVIEVLCGFCDCVERASVDEAYLDMTSIVNEKIKDFKSIVSLEKLQNTFVVGWDKDFEGDDVAGWLDSIAKEETMLNDQKLALAAVIVEEIRAAVFEKTRFRCSAGVAHNKMLAKLACGLHKPNKQTVLPQSSIPVVYKNLSVDKVRNLGGKLGDEVKEKLGIETMGELMNFSENQLSVRFGSKTGSWLYSVARGIDHESVTARQLPKSIGCGKNFPGKQALDSKHKISNWLEQLAIELTERLQKDQVSNGRVARSLTVSLRYKDDKQINAVSRTCGIHIYNVQKIATDALHAIQKLNTAPPSSLIWRPPILSLSLAASKFEDSLDSSTCSIDSYFSKVKSPDAKNAINMSDDLSGKNRENSDKSDSIASNSTVQENVTAVTPGHLNDAVKSTSLSKTPVKGIKGYFSNDTACCSKNSGSNRSTSVAVKNLNRTMFITESGIAKEKVEDQNLLHNENSSNTLCDATSVQLNPTMTYEDNVSEISTCSPKGFFAKKLKEKQEALKASTEVLNSNSQNGTLDSSSIQALACVETDFGENSSVLSFDLNSSTDKCVPKKEESIIKEVSAQEGLVKKSFFQSGPLSESTMSLAKSDTAPDEQGSVENDLSPDISFFCHKCDKRIPCWEEQEHADFHFAQDIQKQIRAVPSVKLNSRGEQSKNVTKLKSSIKRINAKKNISQLPKKSKQQCNTLDAFLLR